MNVLNYNRDAWNRNVEQGNRWTIPVDTVTVDRARRGELQLLLTPTIHVPMEWYPPLSGARALCLASGGGQQSPLLAAAGADVCVLDNSPNQLIQDEFVAKRDGLSLQTFVGDMADLSLFDDDSFDLIFHPCSNCFASDVRPVWRECFRVLKPGGVLLAGFANPVRYIFDDERADNGNLEVKHRLPYSDLTHLTEDERQQMVIEPGYPMEFGHTLDDQIGGQLAAGFHLTGFFEDRYRESEGDALSHFMATFIATRAIKPKSA